MRGMRTTRQQMFKPLKIILNFPTTASQRNFFICFSDLLCFRQRLHIDQILVELGDFRMRERYLLSYEIKVEVSYLIVVS